MFKPTKRWLKAHKEHPESCDDDKCFCVQDDWGGDVGFCVGIRPYDDTDIICFCCSYYDPEKDKPSGHRFRWHPQEAAWIATLLSAATVQVWDMIPTYRSLLKKFIYERGIGIHASLRKDKEEVDV